MSGMSPDKKTLESLVHPPASYLTLVNQLALDAGIPYVDQWSACADFLELIVDHVLQAKPATLLECGSGLTTLVLARACQLNGTGHLYSLENGEQYAQRSRDVLEFYGLSDYVTVLHAPLINYSINQQNYQWYSLAALSAAKVDLFIIDGPPGFIQKHSRYPALPLLHAKLADDCRIFLDDARRDDELEIVSLWQQQFDDCHFEYLELERGCNQGKIRRQ